VDLFDYVDLVGEKGMAPESVLKKYFGYDSFRGEQKSIIETLIHGQDALVLMPTGGGKSLCFQIPSIIRRGVGVIVSPLISLMQDQVISLQENGIKAAYLNSSLGLKESRLIEEQLAAGELDLIYVAPERLVTPRFLQILDKIEVALFAIDEAHCVSTWGHDFRPEYRKLSFLSRDFPKVPKIALTATADKLTRKDIIRELKLDQAKVFLSSFDRTNLMYTLEPKTKEMNQLSKFLNRFESYESGIVYCLSRRKVTEVCAKLKAKGYKAYAYHAGLNQKVRRENQERFIMDEGVIMVATIAFGMGIDKPDVRFVVHMDMPRSLESYYQETGRAGRDGDNSECLLLFGRKEASIFKHMIRKSDASASRKNLENLQVETMLGLCESLTCRRQSILQNFDEDFRAPCGFCDICLEENFPETAEDITEKAIMALTVVYRLGEHLHYHSLIDILSGESSYVIMKDGFHHRPEFGIGKKWKDTEWKRIVRILMSLGLIRLEFELTGKQYFKLSALSLPVLKTEEKIYARVHKAVPKTTRKKKTRRKTKKKTYTRKTPSIGVSYEPVETDLWSALRDSRAKLAKKRRIPAYKVFHDATLREMAQKKPSNLEELLEISGIGETKLKKYGKIFLSIINKDY
jgi:ATP-dependent DNA helicase RecQ